MVHEDGVSWMEWVLSGLVWQDPGWNFTDLCRQQHQYIQEGKHTLQAQRSMDSASRPDTSIIKEGDK